MYIKLWVLAVIHFNFPVISEINKLFKIKKILNLYPEDCLHYIFRLFKQLIEIANPPLWKIRYDQPAVPWEQISCSFWRIFIIKKIKDMQVKGITVKIFLCMPQTAFGVSGSHEICPK